MRNLFRKIRLKNRFVFFCSLFSPLLFSLFFIGCTVVGSGLGGGGVVGGGGAPTVSIPAPVVTRVSISSPQEGNVTVRGSPGAAVGRNMVVVINKTKRGRVMFENLFWRNAYADTLAQTIAATDGSFTVTLEGSIGDVIVIYQVDLLGNVGPEVEMLVGFSVGGTINGLLGTVVLQNNGGDNLTLTTNGAFTFSSALANGASYLVTVFTQPAGQICIVSNGSGTITGSNVTNIIVSCMNGQIIFGTAIPYVGNLMVAGGGVNGIAGADNLCMSDANYPGTGIYKAFITDGTNRVACTTSYCSGGVGEHINWVLAPNTTYLRGDYSTVIGTTTSAGIFSFNLTSSFTGNDHVYWTGLKADWTNEAANADTCVLWGNVLNVGYVGEGDLVDSGSIHLALADICVISRYLLCVQQ